MPRKNGTAFPSQNSKDERERYQNDRGQSLIPLVFSILMISFLIMAFLQSSGSTRFHKKFSMQEDNEITRFYLANHMSCSHSLPPNYMSLCQKKTFIPLVSKANQILIKASKSGTRIGQWYYRAFCNDSNHIGIQHRVAAENSEIGDSSQKKSEWINPNHFLCQDNFNDGSIIFYDKTGCQGESLFQEKIQGESGAIAYNILKKPGFRNVATRSFRLKNLKKGVTISLLANEKGKYVDDWITAITKRPVDNVCVESLESSVSNFNIQTEYRGDQGLEGEVSHLKVHW